MNTSALHKLSYGLYLIGGGADGRQNAQVANAVIQVCSEPPIVAVCLNKQNYTYELVKSGKAFSVAVLAQDTPLRFIGNFGFKSGRDTDKLEGVKHLQGITGAPIVSENTIAYFEAEVISETDIHTHTVFVGKIVAAEVLGEGEPMTYAYYHQVKRGTTPKSAPSYVAEAK
jgi:ferric-chelate reductase [NAD(P)H]